MQHSYYGNIPFFGKFPNKILDIFQKSVYLDMDTKLSIEARRFKKVREELNHTQQYFAEILGIGATTADIDNFVSISKYTLFWNISNILLGNFPKKGIFP